MTFYLIGTGMNKNSIGADALEILKTCDKIYLENYTVNFPYKIKDLKIKLTELDRTKVEDESILQEAKEKNVALLVYGDSLSATTHIQLILEAKKQNIEYKIFHNASIMTAIAETGLQLYKFGKTTSMPNWKEHTNKPKSFADIIKQNQSIKAHTLILTDIGLEIKEAITQLQDTMKSTDSKESEATENLGFLGQESTEDFPEKIIVITNAGTENQKIFHDTPDNLKNQNIKMPFCLIIPSELHFIEKEAIQELTK